MNYIATDLNTAKYATNISGEVENNCMGCYNLRKTTQIWFFINIKEKTLS